MGAQSTPEYGPVMVACGDEIARDAVTAGVIAVGLSVGYISAPGDLEQYLAEAAQQRPPLPRPFGVVTEMTFNFAPPDPRRANLGLAGVAAENRIPLAIIATGSLPIGRAVLAKLNPGHDHHSRSLGVLVPRHPHDEIAAKIAAFYGSFALRGGSAAVGPQA